jgi:Uma2 family endonuclease
MNKLISFPLPGTLEDRRYPDSRGSQMGNSDFHNVAMRLLWGALEGHFADRPDMYVAFNLDLYWKEGDARERSDPDVLVARRTAGKYKRRSFRVWEEKTIPCTLFEISSRRTWRIDLYKKPELYASIGVKEYFLFDPEGCYLDPVLQGFKTVRRQARPMKPARDGSLTSKELGLRFVAEGDLLRYIDLESGQPILTRNERSEQDQQRAADSEQRAAALAAEVQRLRHLLEQRGE